MVSEITQFQQWLRRRNPHGSTHIHYASDLRLFFNWCGKLPDQVGVQEIDAFIEHCQANKQAITTVNRRLAAIRSFFHFLALTRTEAPANPVLPKRHYIHRGRQLPRDVEDQAIEALFSVMDCIRDRAMFLLMLRCGLRVGEVRALDLVDCYLHPTPGQLPRLWLRGKGGGQRVAYLSAQALAALEIWLASRPISPSPAVFLNRFGRRFTVTGIQYRLARHCHQAGIWLTCHQLRHTFARHLVEASVPVTTIQCLLGHARLRTTETYLHVSNTKVQADYQVAMAILADRLALGGDD
jgi:site-specific recombinase XerD